MEKRLIIYKNGVTLRTPNKRIEIFKVQDTCQIIFKSLTREVGFSMGAFTRFSDNGKIKATRLGIDKDSVDSVIFALEKFKENIG